MCVNVYFFPLPEVRSLKTFQLRISKLGSRTPSFCKMADVGLWVGLVSLQNVTKWHITMQRGGVRLAAILQYERLSAKNVKDWIQMASYIAMKLRQPYSSGLRIEYRWLNIWLEAGFSSNLCCYEITTAILPRLQLRILTNNTRYIDGV